MADYRLLSGVHGRWENGRDVTYHPKSATHPGDIIRGVTEAEKLTFGDRIELVGKNDTEEDLESTGELDDIPPPTPLPAYDYSQFASMSWADVIAVVQTLNSPADVEAAKAAETAGRNRKQVIANMDARIAALSVNG